MENMLNALILLANFVIVPAISYGSQLAIGALGATLVYGILRFSNFAHGETMAFGAMATVLLTWLLQTLEISLGYLPTALLALPFAALTTVAFVLLTDKYVYKYYRQKKVSKVFMVIASLGVMFVMNGVIRFVIGAQQRQFFDGEKFIIRARDFKKATGLSEGLSIKMTQGLTLVVSIITVTWLLYFLQKTRTGKSMRAYSDNEDLALLSGINPEKVVTYAWIIAAVLATIAGTLYGLDKSFKPLNYFHLLLPVFAAAIVGGVGSPLGAIAGGFVIAFSEVLMTYAYKKFLLYLLPESWLSESLYQLLSTNYKFAVSFVILVLVLLIRPTGIFKGRVL